MNNISVKFKLKHPNVKVPAYQTVGSAGCDIHADEIALLLPGERKLIKTGLFLEIPEGYECQIRPRSGLALKHGVKVFNSPSTIDSDYRGEIGVLLHNVSSNAFEVNPGDRIAQLVFAPVTHAVFEAVDQLSETDRGDSGWGSTGKK